MLGSVPTYPEKEDGRDTLTYADRLGRMPTLLKLMEEEKEEHSPGGRAGGLAWRQTFWGGNFYHVCLTIYCLPGWMGRADFVMPTHTVALPHLPHPNHTNRPNLPFNIPKLPSVPIFCGREGISICCIVIPFL